VKRARKIGGVAVILFGLLASALCADAPVRVDDSTPMGFLHLTCKALPSGGLPAALGFFFTTKKGDVEVAKLSAEYVLAIAKLEETVRKKWGQAGDDKVVHALGEHAEADLSAGKMSVTGDHAKFQFAGDNSPIALIKVAGRWKIDLGENLGQSDPQEQAGYRYRLKATAVLANQLNADVSGGKYASVDAVCKAATLGITLIIETPVPNN